LGFYSLFKGLVKHWLQALNEHSLHAPFVYDFYTQLLRPDNKEPIFRSIEELRRQFLQDHSQISAKTFGALSRFNNGNQKRISQIARVELSSAKSSRLLYRIAHHYQPKVSVELGTSLGINTLYLSAAHERGTVYTLEGCPMTAQCARNLFDQWPIKNIQLIEGNIDETLPSLLRRTGQVDFAYLDANHRYSPTLGYYHQLKQKAGPGSIFTLDDLYWSRGMEQAWKEIQQDPEVSLSLDLYRLGILFFRPLKQKQRYYLMF